MNNNGNIIIIFFIFSFPLVKIRKVKRERTIQKVTLCDSLKIEGERIKKVKAKRHRKIEVNVDDKDTKKEKK